MACPRASGPFLCCTAYCCLPYAVFNGGFSTAAASSDDGPPEDHRGCEYHGPQGLYHSDCDYISLSPGWGTVRPPCRGSTSPHRRPGYKRDSLKGA
ncbi:hypothetical protein GDO81_005108 [Engystomops pustulosus]|uniref:Secreted protein n=1 Tax=Engystomops pustulosus TaxID=76066 RepID=A0AAV7CKY5_ENGPU|nr:hypothetical protein GDO81_005108 [Engystomops pustulosus]